VWAIINFNEALTIVGYNKPLILCILREDLHKNSGPVGCDIVSLGLGFLTFKGN